MDQLPPSLRASPLALLSASPTTWPQLFVWAGADTISFSTGIRADTIRGNTVISRCRRRACSITYYIDLHRTASIGSWCFEMAFDEKLELHVSLLGDWSVGKTSIIRRFVFDQFDIQKGELEGIDYE